MQIRGNICSRYAIRGSNGFGSWISVDMHKSQCMRINRREKNRICIEASNSTELRLFTCECDVDFDTKSPNRRKNGAKEKNLLRSLDYKYWVCCVRVTTAWKRLWFILRVNRPYVCICSHGRNGGKQCNFDIAKSLVFCIYTRHYCPCCNCYLQSLRGSPLQMPLRLKYAICMPDR